MIVVYFYHIEHAIDIKVIFVFSVEIRYKERQISRLNVKKEKKDKKKKRILLSLFEGKYMCFYICVKLFSKILIILLIKFYRISQMIKQGYK